jgi:hypothetical protein
MEMNGVLGLIEQYGLPLILLLGAIYAIRLMVNHIVQLSLKHHSFP